MGFPGGSDSNESAFSAGHQGLTPGLGDLLENGMATHSRILGWEIPWTGETGGLLVCGVTKSQTRLSD